MKEANVVDFLGEVGLTPLKDPVKSGMGFAWKVFALAKDSAF